jgi:D-tyrosyl-tRNA(Tyr) deacylase
MPPPPLLFVLEHGDPVASAVAGSLPQGEATGSFLDGAPIRAIAPERWRLDRPGLGIHDERLDARLPEPFRSLRPTLLFPSIHRSERGVRCFTVHPLGNPGAALLGGRAGRLGVSAPRPMAALLRELALAGRDLGWPATYEATHHGPELDSPALFAEIALAQGESPPALATRALVRALERFEEDPGDRVAVGVGGGHYAPHFTDLALKRRWAFGHILSRHALAGLDGNAIRSAFERTPGAEGFLFHRAADHEAGPAKGLGPRLLDGEAPPRSRPAGTTSSSSAGDPAAGT